MKRIYIIDGILNTILGMLSYIPFIMGTILISGFVDIKSTGKGIMSGIGIIVLWILFVLLINYIIYRIFKIYSKKIDYSIRKKLYSLIASVMFLGMFLITSAFIAFM